MQAHIIMSPPPTQPSPFWLETTDWHTAGEPFRIVRHLPDGIYLPGTPTSPPTVAARYAALKNDPDPANNPLDVLRRTLCHEPRGHADMYGGFITPPDDAGAHFGVLFWHKGGWATACGHGTIALGCWAVGEGVVGLPVGEGGGGGVVEVVIDVPSGRVKAVVAVEKGKPVHAHFMNVASYQVARSISLEVGVPSFGSDPSQVLLLLYKVDLAFSGALYASIEAGQFFGARVEPRNLDRFKSYAKAVWEALGKGGHGYGGHDLYGVIFYQREPPQYGDGKDVIRQRNVTIFADGQVDRSPCGSGTCASLAILYGQGKVEIGKTKFVNQSIIGSEFEAEVVSGGKSPEGVAFPACLPRVKGQAGLVGQMRFFIDPSDPIYPGFVL